VSRSDVPTSMVGNDFVVPRPQLQAATPLPVSEPLPVFSLPSIVTIETVAHQESIPVSVIPHVTTPFGHLLDLMHRYSIATFALLVLLVATSGIEVGGIYWSAHILGGVQPLSNTRIKVANISGLNVLVPKDQLQAKIQAITSQPATMDIAGQTVAIDPGTIKSWLQISATEDGSQDYIHIKPDVMSKSLSDFANQYVKAPVNQVTVTEDGVQRVILPGQNGTKISDSNALNQQASSTAKSVMDGTGLHFSVPTDTQSYASVGAEAFDKLIDADVTTKQAYFFENGKLIKQYASSDGAPATPTPIGEFHIYEKLASQDMKGYNANGTQYFQPHVHWINYFKEGGYAVHGVYWHPLSWFGVHNSSHGCVGLPDYEAEWVYDWAPIGTTVITHA